MQNRVIHFEVWVKETLAGSLDLILPPLFIVKGLFIGFSPKIISNIHQTTLENFLRLVQLIFLWRLSGQLAPKLIYGLLVLRKLRRK